MWETYPVCKLHLLAFQRKSYELYQTTINPKLWVYSFHVCTTPHCNSKSCVTTITSGSRKCPQYIKIKAKITAQNVVLRLGQSHMFSLLLLARSRCGRAVLMDGGAWTLRPVCCTFPSLFQNEQLLNSYGLNMRFHSKTSSNRLQWWLWPLFSLCLSRMLQKVPNHF